MLQLSQLQETVRAAIAAHPYFAAGPYGPAVSVLSDNGTNAELQAISGQLNSRGFVVTVPPFVNAQRKDAGAGRILLDATILVRVQVNPEQNTTAPNGAQRGTGQAVAAVLSAVLGWSPTRDDRKFDTAENAVQLSKNDPGLTIYDVAFQKLTTPT